MDNVKKTNNNTSVIVSGRNYGNILTMVRALGQAGYDVEGLRVFKSKPRWFNVFGKMKPESRSKYVKKYSECIAGGNSVNVVKALINMADQGEKKLIIPVDDYIACIIDEELDSLKEHFILPNIGETSGQISFFMNKDEQKKAAVLSDLPVLKSVLIKSEGGHFVIPEDVVYPCFVKPNVSMKSTKAKMAKCEDKESLNRVLTSYAEKEDFEMLVEEFAEIKYENSVLGVCTHEGIAAPGCFKVIEGGHRERKGVTIMGELMPGNSLQPIIEKCKEFSKALNYTGLLDVDLIETADGSIYFVELNFRAGASMQAFTDVGINLAGMLADNVIKGIPIDTDCKVEDSGKRFISEKVLLEEYARSDADKAQVNRLMNEADIFFIKDENDA